MVSCELSSSFRFAFHLIQISKSPFVDRIEKYRPKNLESVIFQDEIVSVLRSTLTGSDFPNLLVSKRFSF